MCLQVETGKFTAHLFAVIQSETETAQIIEYDRQNFATSFSLFVRSFIGTFPAFFMVNIVTVRKVNWYIS
jgi:hypothetical protein